MALKIITPRYGILLRNKTETWIKYDTLAFSEYGAFL